MRTLERAIERGEGPPIVRLSERRVGILESDFAAWLLARRSPLPVPAAPAPRGRGRPRKTPIMSGGAA
ncbi:MAG: helix-turn-helix transcriptional regulator [Alphaproteobacteria bacterium]